jgi:hypothetical protein
MSRVELRVADEIPAILEALQNVKPDTVFPNLLAALNAVSEMYAYTWRKYAGGSPIPGTPRIIHSRGDYVRSIQTDTSKPDEKWVFTDYPAHKWIEEGHGEIDLKPGLLAGTKARQGKLGPYTIVGFRHGTPKTSASNNPMPVRVYNFMRQLAQNNQQKSSITGKIPGAKPHDRKYHWGSRLPANMGGAALTKRTSVGNYTWTTGKMTGMTRMDTSIKKTNSQYMTFRIVSYKSDPASWRVPPVQGVAIRQAVVDSTRPEVVEMLKRAVEADLR